MKKIIAIALSALLLLSLPLAALAAEPGDFTDVPTGWSRDAVLAAIENGLLQGHNGKIDPQGHLTRAQMAAILIRAFGVADPSKAADLSAFTDVDPNAWYDRELSLAVGIGLFLGDGQGRLKPNDSITREEVAVVLSRAFYLLDAEADLSGHADAGSISSWARDGMAALVKLGHLRGYPDGTLRPKRAITREEFAQIMARLVARYITAPGEHTFEADGAVVIRVPGVILKDCVLAGDLILGDDVAREDVTLENTVFTTPSGAAAAPRLVVRAEESIVEAGDSGAPPLAGPEDDETPGGTGSPGGGVSRPATYTLDINLSSSVQNLSTQSATGLAGGTLFYLALRDHLRDNSSYLEGQLAAPSAYTGLFGPLLNTLVDDISLDMLADMTELTQYLTVAPGSAAPADRWKDPSTRLSDVEGRSTLIFDDAPFHTEVLVDVGQTGGSYTLQLTISSDIDGLTVSSTLLTGSDRLYGNVFGSVERRLYALLTQYALSDDIAAGGYVDRIETWFDNVPSAELSALFTVRQGSVSPLLDRDANIMAVGGYDFTLRGPGFTLDVSVR